MKKIGLLLSIFCLVFSVQSFAVVRTAVTGTWTTAASNTAFGAVTTSADSIIIPNGVVVTISSTDVVCGALIVQAGGTLGYQSSGNRNVNVVGGGGYTGTVTINGTVAMANSSAQFIAWDGSTFTVASGSNWTWGGTSGADGGLRFTGTGNTTIFGNGKTIGGLTITGAGSVYLSGNVNFRGQASGSNAIALASTSNLIVPTGTTVTLSSNTSASNDFSIASGGKITINGTAVLDNQAGSTGTIAGAGAITLNGTSKYIHNHTGTTLQGSVAGTVVYNSGTTCEVKGLVAATTFAAGSQSFYNFIWNNAGASAGCNLTGSISSVAGTFDVQNTNNQNLRLTGAAALTMNITGDLMVSAVNGISRLDVCNGAGAPTINVTGNVSIGGNSFAATLLSANPSTIKLKGNWIDGTNGTFTSANTTVEFNGTGAQSITKSGGESFNILTISNSANTVTANNNVTISGAATIAANANFATANTLTANSSLIVTGTLSPTSAGVIAGSGTLTGSGTAKVTKASGSGDFLGQYTISNKTLTNLTVEMAGVAAQGLGANTFSTLKISNNAGVTLGGAVSVTGTLNLSSGQLLLGSNNLTLTGATISNATSSNYIVTNSSGSVLRSIASGGGTFTFPIGRTITNYNPITITNTGAATAIYTVGSAPSTYSPSLDGAGGQWSIAASAITTSTLAFSWFTSVAGANLAATPAAGKTHQYNGSTWDNRGGLTSPGTPNVTSVSGITSLTNPIWTVALVNTPPVVTTTTTTNITTTSADGGGNVTDQGTASVTAKGVKYGTTSPANDVTTNDGSGAGSYSSSLSPLVANTKYFYRAYATSYTTSFGTELDFTTLPNAPVVGTPDNATSIGFTAHWTAPLSQGVESFTYVVEADDDINFGSVNETSPGLSSATLQYVFTLLDPGVTYYFRVKAVNVQGSGAWSSTSSSIMTSAATAPTGVTTGTVGNITVAGATITGNNITTDGGSDLTARGLVYNTTSPAQTGGTLVPEGGTAIGSFNQTLSTLSANTLYYVKAYATNGIGTTYGSNEASFTTLAAEPTTASTVTVPTRTDITLTVNFTSGNGTRRIVVARQGAAVSFVPTDGSFPSGTISSNFASATDQGNGNKIVYDGTGSSVVVSGLVKNTNYQFAVYEYNNNSASSPNFLATAGTASATTYNPTVVASGTLSFGNQVTGTSSASQSYNVSGSELVSNITITAPANFQVSLDDADFTQNPVLIAKNGSDAVPSTLVYIRFSPSAATGASGSLNVTNAATNATTQNVVVSGTAIAAEPTNVGTLSFGAITPNSIVLNYALPGSGNGTNRIIVAKAGSAPTGVPVDATAYTANAAYGTVGTALGDGFVVYNNTGSGNSLVTVSNLTGTTTYYFAVYEYNVGTGTSQNYFATAATGNAQTTDATLTTDYFRSNTASGDWDNTASWQSSHTGNDPWISATAVPTSTATAVDILNSHNITISVAKTVGTTTVNDGGMLTVTGTGALTVASSKTLTVNVNAVNGGGTIDYQSTGIPVITGTLVVNGNYKVNPATAVNNAGMVPAATWGASSFLYILKVADGPASGTGNDALRLPTSMNGTVVWNCNPASGGTTTPYYTFINGATTLGKLIVINTGGRPISHSSASTNRNLTVTDLDIQGGDYTVSVTATTSTTTVNGNLSISGGTFAGVNTNMSGVSGTGAIVLKGSLTISGGSIGGKLGTNTGTGTFTLNGAAAQTIAASGTYTLSNITAANSNASGVNISTDLTAGNLTVSSGIVSVAGTKTLTSSTAVTVSSGATLSGLGTVAAAVSAAGTISPNTTGSIGTLSETGNMSFGATGIYQVDINNTTGASGTINDLLAITGNLSVAAGASVNISGTISNFVNTNTYTWTIATVSGTVTNLSNFTVTGIGLTNSIIGSVPASFTISQSGSNIILTYAASSVKIWNISTNAGAWLTAGNWTPSGVPTSSEIAQFDANPNTSPYNVGINMNGATNNGTNNQVVAGIYVSSARANNLVIGNSSTTAGGTLTLAGGGYISGAAATGVIINQAANQSVLTIQNVSGSGNQTMALNLPASATIVAGAGTTTTIGNTINITSVTSGASSGISFLGGGNGTTNGGLLRLGATNTFVGGVSVGNTDGTQYGILQLDVTGALSNTTGNNVTINPNSQLFLNASSGSTYTTGNITLTLKGAGNTVTATYGAGALRTAGTNSYTWTGPVSLGANSTIYNGGTLTLSGALSGTGFNLTKDGAGALNLTRDNLSYTGSTSVNAGSIVVSKTGYTATITPTNVTMAFSPAPAAGTYAILPGALNGSQAFNATGLAANQVATFNASNSTVTVTNQYTITVTQSANGTIAPGTTTVNEGANQTFTITPASSCYSISSLTVDGNPASLTTGNSDGGTYDFNNVSANHTLTATYVLKPYTITVNAGANGSITPGTGSVNCGSTPSYTITPDACYSIASLTVDGNPVSLTTGTTDAGGTYVFPSVTAAHTIAATFSLKTYSITVTQAANGTIAPGSGSVDCGSNNTYTITPDACYHITDVIVDGSSVGVVSSVDFNNVTGNHTITASFAIDTYTITASAGANGSISPSGAVVVNCGTGQSFIISPNPGYSVQDVIVDGNSVGAVTNYSFPNVSENHTISASFVLGCTPGNWIGGTGNWSNAANWSCNTVPTSGTAITISAGSPVLDVDFTVANSLVLSGSGGLTIAPNKTLTISGSANFGDRPVTVVSNSSGTGAIGTISGSLSGASNVTVERYIPTAKRAWRLLSLPVTGPTLNQAWAAAPADPTQNRVNGSTSGQPTNNGTLITGNLFTSGAVANAAGFDWWQTGASSSIRFYTNNGSTGTWDPANNTPDVKAPADKQGYLLFVRGDRTVTSGSGTTTLRPTGSVKTGDQLVPVSTAFSHIVVGNPYASPFNFETMRGHSANASLVKDQFWIWDATYGTNGGYKLVIKNGSWNAIPSPYTAPPATPSVGNYQYIQSGEAFFVEPLSNGNLTISETDKETPASLPTIFDAPAGQGMLFTNLNQDNGGSQNLTDGVLAVFGQDFNKTTTDRFDIKKLLNLGENFSLIRNGSRLTMEALPYVSGQDTLYFNMSSMTVRNYNLQFKAVNLQAGLTARLEDGFTGKSETIGTNDGDITTYAFSVTSAAGSAAADRFRIVFKADQTLPLTLNSARAYQQGSSAVQVDWKATNERNLRSYEVEKSLDGRSFTKASTVAAKNSSEASYSWLDATATKGLNYYRIKAISNDGTSSYSQVLLVNINNGKSLFSIYPNPARGGVISLQFSNMDRGQYELEMYNSIGQQMLVRSINHAGGSSSEELKLPKSTAAGVYKMVLRNSNGIAQTETIIVE